MQRVHRNLSLCLLLVAAAGGLAACGGGAVAPGPEVAQAPDAADLHVARAVYGIDPSLPAGFYNEPNPYPDRQTFTVHVKSHDMPTGPMGQNYELCTDDFAEALDWSATNAAAQGFTTSLTSNSDSEWYYQFDRAIDASEPAMLINRVFKCSQLDRSGLSDAGAAGVINHRPVDAADLRWVAEYLWTFSPYNNALHAVIESSGSTTADRLVHRIQRAFARKFAGSKGCDLIEVWNLDYTSDRTSGTLQQSEEFVRVFEASYETGQAVLCDP